MKVRHKVKDGNSGRATPSLRYHQNQIELNNNKGYFIHISQNNLPEDFPNSK
jgi:hypothetical protein